MKGTPALLLAAALLTAGCAGDATTSDEYLMVQAERDAAREELAAVQQELQTARADLAAARAQLAEAPPLGLASEEVRAVLEGRVTAWMSEDFPGAAAFYAEDAVLYELMPGWDTRGREEIGRWLGDLYGMGLRLEATSAPIQFGRFAAEAVHFYQPDDDDAYGEGMLVYEIDQDGLIANQWVFEWLCAGPPDC